MVHIQHDTLGEVVKNARQRSNLTMEELAYRLQVSPRYDVTDRFDWHRILPIFNNY